MTIIAIIGGAVIWIACGIIAYRIDKRDFPNPVVPGADQLFSAVLLLSGPAGLAGILFMRSGKK